MGLIFKIVAALLLLALPALAYSSQGADAFVKKELMAMLPWDNGSVEIDDIEIPGFDGHLAPGMTIDVPKRPQSPGKVSFRLVPSNGREGRPLWGTARIKVYKDAVVALRTIRNKEVVSGQDLKMVRVELDDAVESFQAVEDAAGMVAKRPISAGSVIKKEYVRPEVLVKKGANVAVNVEGNAIKVRSKGVAKEDGSMGSTVLVRMSSGKEVPGVVSGPNELSVNF